MLRDPSVALGSVAPLLLGLAGLVASAARPSAQTIWHVDAGAPPGGDGLTWATALDSLQPALDLAASEDHIWVTAGTYYPTNRSAPADARSARFRMDRSLALFGGFAGHETSVAERDPSRYTATVLSGDLGVRGDPGDNAYHVVEVATFALPGLVRMNGFRITGGSTPGSGGGVLAKMDVAGYSPRLRLENCLLDSNRASRGGAISAERFGVVYLVRCVVERNTSSNLGGAAYSRAGGIIGVGTRFSENKAKRLGGVLFSDSSADGWIRFVNCSFTANQARNGGVAFLQGDDFSSGIASWYNCTFAENVALGIGGVLHADTSTPVPALAYLYNSILWNNSAPANPAIFGVGHDVRFCDVQGGYPGFGNLNVDPLLTASDRPRAGSPVNDAGSNGFLPPDFVDFDRDGDRDEELEYDILGRPRRSDDPLAPDTGAGTGPIVDLGAYEAGPLRDPSAPSRP